MTALRRKWDELGNTSEEVESSDHAGEGYERRKMIRKGHETVQPEDHIKRHRADFSPISMLVSLYMHFQLQQRRHRRPNTIYPSPNATHPFPLLLPLISISHP
jgi:hypothetical protein